MFIRQCFRKIDGQRRAYWALVESYRSERGPRQRVVAWLGRLDEAGRLGVQQAAGAAGDGSRNTSETRHAAGGDAEPSCVGVQSSRGRQQSLFEYQGEPIEPRWVQVNVNGIRVENCREFGGPWLALELIGRLNLDEFLEEHHAATASRCVLRWWSVVVGCRWAIACSLATRLT